MVLAKTLLPRVDMNAMILLGRARFAVDKNAIANRKTAASSGNSLKKAGEI
jgi:hypothetical protein